MIYIVFKDRLGNFLFQYAAARSLSDNVVICAPTDDVYRTVCSVKDIFFKDSEIIRFVPENIPVFEHKQLLIYETVIYDSNKDLILKGYFQSFKYIDRNIIKDIYKPNENILKQLKTKYPQIFNQKFTSIHVRRGDYLKLQEKHPFAGLKYYRQAIYYIGKDKNFIVVSDDIDWCKKHFKGNNFVFADNTTIIEDFFIQIVCASNIMSNSTFSWWGSYLNDNKNKTVVVPSMWFGFIMKNVNTKDLIPKEYIVIKNSYPIWILLSLKLKVFCKRVEWKIKQLNDGKISFSHNTNL